MSQALTCITVAKDGSILGIDNSNNILQATQDPTWTEAQGQTLQSIAASSDGSVYGITNAPAVVLLSIGSDGTMTWPAVSFSPSTTPPQPANPVPSQVFLADSADVFVIDTEGYVWYRPSTGIWQGLGNTFSTMSAPSDNSIWGLDGGTLYSYDAGSWVAVNPQPAPKSGDADPVRAFSAGSAGWIWAVGSVTGTVYQYDGPGNNWKIIQKESTFQAISCGDDNTVMAIDKNGKAWLYNSANQKWDRLPDPAQGSWKSVSVGNYYNTWAVDTSNNVYQFTLHEYVWKQVAANSPLVQISAGSATNIWGVTAISAKPAGHAYQITGGADDWNPVGKAAEGAMVQVCAAADGSVWGIQAGTFKIWNGDSFAPSLPTSNTAAALSAGSATNVWAIDTSGNICSFDGTKWTTQSASTAQKAIGSICAAADGSVWMIDQNKYLNMWLESESAWYQTGVQLQQVAAGSIKRIWGIDLNNDAVEVIGPGQQMIEGSIVSGARHASAAMWACDSKRNPAQNTHLWIVQQAANVLNSLSSISDPAGNGKKIASLLSESQPEFYEQFRLGLWAADHEQPYDGPHLGGMPWNTAASYAAHFWSPATGKNWQGSSSWTAVTQGLKYFWLAVAAYQINDLKHAGFCLGLALHFFTDLTQPMHSSNFTYMSSSAWGYHGAFEDYAMDQQYTPGVQGVIPTAFTAAKTALGADPTAFLTNAALASNNYYNDICPASITEHYSDNGLTTQQKQTILQYIPPILTQAINLASQFLLLWMQTANASANVNVNRVCVLVSASNWTVLDAPTQSDQRAGTQLQQNQWNNTNAECFALNVLPQPSGKIQIVCLCTGMVLDVGNSTTTSPVTQQPPNAPYVTSQVWQMTTSSGLTTFQNAASGLFLSIDSNGNAVQSPQGSSGYAQQWLMAPAAPVKIVFAGKKWALDVTRASGKDGTVLQLWDYNQDDNNAAQIFLLVPNATGTSYAILNKANMYMVCGTSSGVVMNSFDSANASAYQWSKVTGAGGYVNLKNANGYMSVDKPSKGAPIILSSDQGRALGWQLVPFTDTFTREDVTETAQAAQASGSKQ